MYTHSLANPNLGMVLWRYISYQKLESLLDKSALYFCRVNRYSRCRAYGQQPLSEEVRLRGFDNPEYAEDYRIIAERMRMEFAYTCVNCWHIGDAPEEPLWNEYVGPEDGVAIKTTFHALTTSITSRIKISASVVKQDFADELHYPDHTAEHYYWYISWGDLECHDERELRLRTTRDDYPYICQENINAVSQKTYRTPAHQYVKVDLQTLVQQIVLKPGSDDQFIAKVLSTLRMHDLSDRLILP